MNHTTLHEHDDLPSQPPSVPVRGTYLHAEVLNDHLQQVARRLPSDERRTLSDGLTYASAIYLLDHDAGAGNRHVTDTDEAALQHPLTTSRTPPGCLSRVDMTRYGVSSHRLMPGSQQQLTHELKDTLISIANLCLDAEEAGMSDFATATASSYLGTVTFDIASEVPGRIRTKRKDIEREHKLSNTCRSRIARLVDQINEIHPRLEQDLIDVTTTLPSLLNSARTAQADLLSSMVESALGKLSLIRTRMHLALYHHVSPGRPHANMNRALVVATEKLRARICTQEEEECELDGQLAAYDGMLGLMGGRDGDFAQVVEDMARVKRETEECRKDLRRLGWTGD